LEEDTLLPIHDHEAIPPSPTTTSVAIAFEENGENDEEDAVDRVCAESARHSRCKQSNFFSVIHIADFCSF
jgi:hypothetical protein